ncbi:MAG: hypothetical protein WCO51_13710 [bacterium]
MSNIFKVGAYIIVACLSILPGCGNEPPECGAPAMVDKVKIEIFKTIFMGILKNGFNEDVGNKALKIVQLNITTITAEGYEKEAKRRTCAGKLIVKVPDLSFSDSGADVSKTGNHPYESRIDILEIYSKTLGLRTTRDAKGGLGIRGENVEAALTFNCQNTADNKEQLVTINGYKEISDFVVGLAMSTIDLVSTGTK